MAATATVPGTTSSTAATTAFIDLNSTPTNSADVTANNQNNTANQTIDGTNNTNVVDANLFGAVAIGNSVSNTVAMSLYGGDTSANTGSGIGILNFSANQGPLAVVATANGDAITGSYLNLTSGVADSSTSSISASTTLNAAIQTVATGGVPLDLVGSGAAGAIAFNSLGQPLGDLLDSAGGVSVANIQTNVLAGVLAGSRAGLGQTTANTMSLAIGNSGDTPLQPVTATATENANSLSANYTGNSAANSVGMNATGAPAYVGSVAVSNVQSNQDFGGIGGSVAAVNQNSSVSATIAQSAAGGSGGGTLMLAGALQVNNNTISASATNNSAVGATAGTGDSITLANGLSYASAEGQTSGNAIYFGPDLASTATLTGGLGVLNAQTNGAGEGAAVLNATVGGAAVATSVENALGASISTNTNAITSSTEGNVAFNAIAVGGAASASINGSANIASVQIDAGDPNGLAASQTTGTISTQIAAVGPEATITGSTVAQNGNTIGAISYGNDVGNSLTLAAEQVVSGGTTPAPATLSASRSGGATFDANGAASDANGSTINSVQAASSPFAAASASTTNASVTMNVGDLLAVSGDTLSETGNTLQAIAASNTAASALGVSGGGFTGSLGVLNGQTDASPVVVQLIGATVGLTAGVGGADVDGSTLTASGNRLRTLGYGDRASNSLSVSSTDIAVPGSGGAPATSVTVTPNDPSFDIFGVPPTVTAGLAVLNDQAVTSPGAAVTASNLASSVLIQVGFDLNGGSATADSNQVTLVTVDNLATNGATLAAGSVGLTAAAAHPSLASVLNVQEASDRNSSSTAGDRPQIQVQIGRSVNGSTIDASSNAILGDMEANTSTNTLAVTATSLIAPVTGAGLTGASYQTGTLSLTNDAALTITNAQQGLQNGWELTTGYGVLFAANGDISSSTVSADGNSATASTSGNTATNTLGVTATNLQAAVSLQSLQIDRANLTVAQTADAGGVTINFYGTADASTLTANANTASVSAIDNSATNTITVSAGSMDKATGAIPIDNWGARVGPGQSSTATGDVSLQNLQTLTASSLMDLHGVATTSIKASTVPIIAVLVTNSHELVNANQATASGQDNVATNTVSITAASSSAAATGALLSVQNAGIDVPITQIQATSIDTVQAAGLVSGSTVEVSNNGNLALATSNTVANRFTVGGGADLGSGYGNFAIGSVSIGGTTASADFAVANVQAVSNGILIADAEASFGNSDIPLSISALTVDHSTVTFAGDSNSAQTAFNIADNRLTLTPGASLAATGAVTSSQSDTLGSTSSTASGTVSYGETNFTASHVAVSGNLSSAVSFGNSATTGLVASGVSLSRGDSIDNSVNAQANSLGNPGAVADYTVVSLQSDILGLETATNTGRFVQWETIPVVAGVAATTGSTLTVDGNVAQAAAEGNVASNSLTLSATNALNVLNPTLISHAATGALVSSQVNGGQPNASSYATYQATGMVSTSTVDISGNSNLALAIAGDVINTVTATAGAQYDSGNTTSFAGQGATAESLGMVDGSVSADLALNNVQNANFGGVVSSTVVSTIGNNDSIPASAGAQALTQSAVTITANRTTAESDANRAANTLALNAGSALGATAGIANRQLNALDANAAVGAAVSFSEPNATASTVALNENTSMARASGDTASNVLNATASAQYVIPAGLSASAQDFSGVSGQAIAQYVVLNGQNSSGAISATNTTTQELALGSTSGAGGTVNGSSLSVSANSVGSQATGNAATNAIGLSLTASGSAPAAIASLQSSSGSINATVSGSTASISAGLGTGAGVSGSTMAVVGNSMVARATGNSVVNTIGAK